MARVFIIAGHGAGDSGAVGNGYTEAERVRALANRIKALGGDSVMLGDTSRNWYADNGISRLTIPKDYQIVELHMDSGVYTARGGHVIIQDGLGGADQYDNALAAYISTAFPGRSSKLVERSDLANPGWAATMGYGYRLIECGFISNATDVKIFNNNLDKHAAGILEAFDIKAKTVSSDVDGDIKSGGTSQATKDQYGDVTYRVHMRDTGWGARVCDGQMAGTTGQNRRIEAMQLVADDLPDVAIHLKDIGDRIYKNVTKDTVIGTTGQNRRMEAIKITGKKYFYMYRVHQKDLGWSDWANNGEWAGVRGVGKQIEAIEIKIAMFAVTPHVQDKGWLGKTAAENVIGITGHALRLEAFKIDPYGLEIAVKAHLQDDGWVDYGVITKDTIIGSVGQKKRLECLCFKGAFEYRVHVQGSGWTDWTKADGIATLGTVGQALRIEAIQFRPL